MNRKNIFNCKITYTVTPIFLKNFYTLETGLHTKHLSNGENARNLNNLLMILHT